MDVLDDYTVVVYNPAELGQAVGTGNIYNYVYLGADIALTSGITVAANKSSLVIDGLYRGYTRTFTDIYSTSSASTIGIRGTSSISITFRNMTMTGMNYYGIPFVTGDSLITNTSGVIVTYENIMYRGPQITYNPDGITRYRDCNITIEPYGTVPAEEVGEVSRVEFYGENTISHTTTSDAVFWFRGLDRNTPYFHIMPGASLTVNTSNYFMYSMVPTVLPVTQNPVAYEIREGGKFILNSDHGISYDSNHRASSFLMETGAEFQYIQTRPNGSSSSFYINGNFTVNEGARLYMQSAFGGASPLIHFMQGGNNITVSNPKSFVLYNSSSTVFFFGSTTARNFTVGGGQVNYWNSATAIGSGAGTFTDIPYRKWNRPTWTEFSINGTVSPTLTTISGSTLTPEEIGNLPALNDLHLQSAMVLSIGSIMLVNSPVISDGRAVTGVSDPGAEIRITYNIGGIDYTEYATADSSGRYSVTTAGPIPIDTVVTVSANIPFLIISVESRSIDEGHLYILSAPSSILYRLPLMSQPPDPVLFTRTDPEVPVIVFDDRNIEAQSQWRLYVSISGPLMNEYGETLPESVVFRENLGPLETLSQMPIPVYTGGPDPGTTNVYWDRFNGILINPTVPIRSGAVYRTGLVWDLQII